MSHRCEAFYERRMRRKDGKVLTKELCVYNTGCRTEAPNGNGNAIALVPWILLQTNWCREYQALENLERLQIETYLPRTTEMRRAGFHSIHRQPMFPSYIFARMRTDSSIPAVRGVSGPVRFGDRFAEVEESIIDALRSREIDGLIDLTEEGLSAVRPGAEVKVASGPFADLVGIFQKRTGKERAMILLNVLGGMQRVEMPVRDLRFLPGRVGAAAY
jgi:transcriptional antiterminator RfaH